MTTGIKLQHSYFGNGVIDTLMHKFTAHPYPGENHAYSLDPRCFGKSYRYVGPGTRLDIRLDEHMHSKAGQEPLNALYETAYNHDVAYLKAGNAYRANPTPENKKIQMHKVWKADDAFVHDAKAQTDDKVMGKIAAGLIRAKELGEKTHLLDTKKFSGFGKRIQKKKKRDPTANLKRQVMKSVKTTHKKIEQLKSVVDFYYHYSPPFLEQLLVAL